VAFRACVAETHRATRLGRVGTSGAWAIIPGMSKPLPLPSGMTQAQLREAAESAIAAGQLITVNAPDLLALLVSLDLRQRLDPDVEECARTTKSTCEHRLEDYPTDNVLIRKIESAERVLAHRPLPDMSEVPS
jgi:hypothetical protein